MSFSECEVIVTSYEENFRYGGFSVKEMAAVDLVPFAGLIDGEIIHPDDLLFLDTETTGLSGGAGTVAFLVGIGYFSQNRFMIKQYLMRDYDEEYPMLCQLDLDMKNRNALVTYNGKAFDMNLLTSRFIMNGMRIVQTGVHLDLLYVARKLWRNSLENCRLITLEEAVLSEYRKGDIPGYLIPQIYFEYLRSGNKSLLDEVLLHNRLDILAMASVLKYVCSISEQPELALKSGRDELFGLAGLFESIEDKNRAESLYIKCVEAGRPPVVRQALARLADMKKRSNAYQDAVSYWNKMLAFTPKTGVYPYIELAKYFEHKVKDFVKAKEYADQAKLLADRMVIKDEKLHRELVVRQSRLTKRIERKSKEDHIPMHIGETSRLE